MGWRLHIKGETYLASASSTAKFAKGRFEPLGRLPLTAEPSLDEIDRPIVRQPPVQTLPKVDLLELITPEDRHPKLGISGKLACGLRLRPMVQWNHSEQSRALTHARLQMPLHDLPVKRPWLHVHVIGLNPSSRWRDASLQIKSLCHVRRLAPWPNT